LALALSTPCAAGPLDEFTDKQMATGLKDALQQGIANSVTKLGREGGFLNDIKVKIPLPGPLKKAERILRTVGMGDQADALVTSMNRAAESAVPEAKVLLVDAVKNMSIQDVKAVLTGGDDSATQYFRKSTEQRLRERFLPIVTHATEKVGLAQKYDQFGSAASSFGLLDKNEANVEEYVTHKALDGLYLMMAEEEKHIRANPVQATTSILKEIFGVLRK
jgi:hypothetical protein